MSLVIDTLTSSETDTVWQEAPIERSAPSIDIDVTPFIEFSPEKNIFPSLTKYSENSAAILVEELKTHTEYPELLKIAREKIAALDAAWEIKNYLKTPSVNGYLQILRVLDDSFSSVDVGAATRAELSALSNHMFTVAYIENHSKGDITVETKENLETILYLDTVMVGIPIQQEVSNLNRDIAIDKLRRGNHLLPKVSAEEDVLYKEKIARRNHLTRPIADTFNLLITNSISNFDSKDPKNIFKLENIFAHAALFLRYQPVEKAALASLVEGIRGELVSYVYLKEVMGKAESFLFKATEGTPNVYQTFLAKCRGFLPETGILTALYVEHAPKDMDEYGIADLVLRMEVQDRESGKEVTPIFMSVDTKVDYLPKHHYIHAGGMYAKPAGTRLIAVSLEGDEDIRKSTPDSVIPHVESTGMAVVSMRIPAVNVKMRFEDTGVVEHSKGSLVHIGAQSIHVNLLDVRQLVLESSYKQVNMETLLYTVNDLLTRQKEAMTFKHTRK